MNREATDCSNLLGRALGVWGKGLFLLVVATFATEFATSKVLPNSSHPPNSPDPQNLSVEPKVRDAESGQDADQDFEAVATILESRCISCHNANISEGELGLHGQRQAMVGGESGAVIVPGEPEESLLLEYIRGPDAYMPPEEAEGGPLSQEQVSVIESWIADGANWPDGRILSQSHLKDRSWWSLRPLEAVQVPKVDSSDEWLNAWPRNKLDQFVLKRLVAKGLHPASEADPRTLIRRLYFDVVGLPPTPAEIEAFVRDQRPDAYERLVDKLLDSPRYGERWARHWLDVVHYGDTHGYDKDKPRDNAWPYRDYVIRSLNSDKRWSRFVREQIAGDVLFPNTRDGIEALGFIAAGPWDFVGHAEVSEDKVDGKIARHLDRDDMVRNTMQSFTGLTVGCAQCHDHKFDPITQLDYYRLHAVFAALDRADKSYDTDPKIGRQRRLLTQSIADQRQVIRDVQSEVTARVASELAAIDELIGKQDAKRPAGTHAAFGYHSNIESKQNVTKWVQIDLGDSMPVRRIVLRPCKDDFNGIGAGFGFPVRFKIELSNAPDFSAEDGVVTIADETTRDFPNPALQPVIYQLKQSARYLRITATRLAPRKDDFIFALAEVEVFAQEGDNLALSAKVSSLDSIESGTRWRQTNLTDGHFFSDQEEVDVLKRKRLQLIRDSMTGAERTQVDTARTKVQSDQQQLESLPKQASVYAGTVYTGTGSFIGTGPNDGKPRPIRLLERGDVTSGRQIVKPGALSVLGMERHFELSPTHQEGDRRAALALWLTDPDNPLTWRSIVNRVWQYHFGRGIVDTPNDFGRMGGEPSHPELLDFLAIQFRDEGQSLKKLHRMILTSATWRQSSQPNAVSEKQAVTVDADNRLLWKMARKKLEAEAIRDSVLLVSGKLDLSMYGPGYRDFVLKHPEHSPHYEYHLHDPDDPATHRRSIYRFVVRSQMEPFMCTLDCADPSILVGRRNQSLTPLQSLTMLNSGLMVTMAEHFASRLEDEYEDRSEQVRHGFQNAIGRPPSSTEHSTILRVAEEHGLANACRLIFNLNEFSFVD